MRPRRPNPYNGPRERHPGQSAEVQAKRPWRATHVKQETRRERKTRLRIEAMARCEVNQGHALSRDDDSFGQPYDRCFRCGFEQLPDAIRFGGGNG